MIPSILAKQYIEAITSYIDTTFPITNEYFKDAFKSFINNEKFNSVFHKPYVSIRLPFRVENYVDINFDSIKLQYTPFSHQLKAYKRLNAENPKSTLVTTGIGSGKTECFLYSILEYCYKHKKENGIKAIIIYPMNALASDQARRIANTIYNNKKLKEPKLKNLSDNDLSVLLDSLYALISYARVKDKLSNIRPFLFVNVQVWMRELRRVLAKVSAKKENVDFALASDLNDKQIAHYLPVVNCRHCGATGFASVLDE